MRVYHLLETVASMTCKLCEKYKLCLIPCVNDKMWQLMALFKGEKNQPSNCKQDSIFFLNAQAAEELVLSGLPVVLRPSPFCGFLARGAQSILNDSPPHGEGSHSEEEGFAVDDDDSDGEPNTWELLEGAPGCPPKEQAADLFSEDWDLELKADQGNPYGRCGVSGQGSETILPDYP